MGWDGLDSISVRERQGGADQNFHITRQPHFLLNNQTTHVVYYILQMKVKR